MTDFTWLALYSALILLFSLGGGYLPFLGRVTHFWLQIYLSLAAGIMLGAAFFHVMPEAFELSKEYFGWWMALAVVGLYCIERFIAPHSHEIDGGHHDHLPAHKPGEPNGHGHDHGHGHGHGHGHHHVHEGGKEPRAAAPAVAGWMAVLGLTIHTFMNGFGLAGEVQLDAGGHGHWFFPGLPIFLAIILHKPADALAISMVLSRKGVSRRRISLVQLGFALMVPAGAAAYFLTRGLMAEGLRTQLTGAALAFSAGTFLLIALSDLLPEVQFHKHDRLPIFLALALSVAFMGAIAYLEDLGRPEEGNPPAGQVEGTGGPERGDTGPAARPSHQPHP